MPLAAQLAVMAFSLVLLLLWLERSSQALTGAFRMPAVGFPACLSARLAG